MAGGVWTTADRCAGSTQRMATSHASDYRRTDANKPTAPSANSGGTRHSKEDAISQREFELLDEATLRMDEYYGLQCRFVLWVTGRIGLRAGEVAHMTTDWIDWDAGKIDIPEHQPCTNGRGGTVCGSCRQHAQQKARIRTANGYDEAWHDLGIKDELEPGGGEAVAAVVETGEMVDRQWTAKTPAAARRIPYDALTRAELVVERFFDRFDEWPHSNQAVNRRVDRMVEASDAEIDNLYPHALRSTASNYWVGRDLDSDSLMYKLGWATKGTAQRYIDRNPERAAKAIYEAAP